MTKRTKRGMFDPLAVAVEVDPITSLPRPGRGRKPQPPAQVRKKKKPYHVQRFSVQGWVRREYGEALQQEMARRGASKAATIAAIVAEFLAEKYGVITP